MFTESKFRAGVFALLLAIVTAAVYGPVRNYEFNNYDDPDYVAENLDVQEGLTGEGVAWAFGTGFASNWHPLTWLSHMLDCQLFGVDPGAHHLVNVALHVLNALLLFMVFWRMTGDFGPSAFVATLFALHPLNVEVVAWVAERKHLLASFFWFLTMWAYWRYATKPGAGRYLAVIVLFALGLLAKPLLVTLPFVLLLLDYWPLRRFQTSTPSWSGSGAAANPAAVNYPQRDTKFLILEKVPLLLFSVASSVVAFLVARSDNAVASAERYPFLARLGNALVSYVLYIVKTVFPDNLAVLYPHPGFRPLWQVGGAAVLLLFATWFVILFYRSKPYLLVGWLWFLGTLIPMIGLVQVSDQAMADRYAYTCVIGLFIMIAWSAADLLARWPQRKQLVPLAGAAVAVVLCLITAANLPHWRNSVSLFTHALSVTTNNSIAHYGLGQALSILGQHESAVENYRASLHLRPTARAYNNLGLSLANLGQLQEATNHYAAALRLQPNNESCHFNYALALTQLGLPDAAADEYRVLLRLNPSDHIMHGQLGILLRQQNKTDEAIAQLKEALRLKPDYPDGLFYLGTTLLETGKVDEAVPVLSSLVKSRPESAEAHSKLALAYRAQDKPREACVHFREALRLRPDAPVVLNNLAWLLATFPDPEYRNGYEAVQLAERACTLSRRKEPVLLGTLAAAYAEAGQFDQAIKTATEAEELARSLNQTSILTANQDLLKLYRAGKPYREAARK